MSNVYEGAVSYFTLLFRLVLGETEENHNEITVG